MPAKRERPEENMSDSKAVTGREAFEKWFLTCTEQPTIWEAWQAAQSADREEFELLNSQNRDLAHEVSLLLEQIGVLKAEIEQDGQMFIDSKKLILDAQGRAKSAEHKLTESGEAVKPEPIELSETIQAAAIANKILERPNADPDSGEAILARQYLRVLEKHERLTGEAVKELWRDAAIKLVDYCEAHNWGNIPEPFDSINPLLKLLGRSELKEQSPNPPISQVTIVGRPQPKTWKDYREGALANYGGGHRSDGHLEAFQHGMETVFNLIEAEFPPAEHCKVVKELREALEEIVEEANQCNGGKGAKLPFVIKLRDIAASALLNQQRAALRRVP